MNAQFEISLFSNLNVDLAIFKSDIFDFFDKSIKGDELANVLKFKTDKRFEYFITINRKNLFSRETIFLDINELIENVYKIFSVVEARFGFANYEINSLLIDEQIGLVPSDKIINESTFLFIRNDLELNNLLFENYYLWLSSNNNSIVFK